jgi:hypothetical protein
MGWGEASALDQNVPSSSPCLPSAFSLFSLADLLVAQPGVREQLVEGSRLSAMHQVQSALRSHALPAEPEPSTGAVSLEAILSLPVGVPEGG